MANLDTASNMIKSVKVVFDAKDDEFKSSIKTQIDTISSDLSSLNENEIIENLSNVIKLLNECYYTLEKPLVSDDIYDTIFDFLEELDPENEVFKSVGEVIEDTENTENDFFQKSKHEIIAGSQSKVKKSETEKFKEKIGVFNSKVTISDKMDGITLVTTYTADKEKAFEHLDNIFEHHLSYIEKSNKNASEKKKIKEYIISQKNKMFTQIKEVEDGNFFPYKIVTRGDGVIGEDITLNALDAKGIVFEINKSEFSEFSDIENFELIVRSEAIITLDDFASLAYKNPRNGVATIRKQNGRDRDKITSIPFEKIIHDLNTDDLYYPNRNEMFKWFEKQGFENPYYETFDKIEDMESAIELRLSDRANDKINYWIDGLVLSIDDAGEREKLGMVGKKPRGEFAFKPDPEISIAQIEKIEFTVGKTGNITPVAQFKEPVPISGSDIEFVSLANENIMKEVAPAVGSMVEVVKRGEIIPKIERNVDLEPINSLIEEFVINNFIEGTAVPAKEKKRITELYHDGMISKIFNRNISENLSISFVAFLKDLLRDEVYQIASDKPKFRDAVGKLVLDAPDNAESIISNNINSQISYPANCPSCGSELEKGKVLVKCMSKSCRGKHIAQLTFFAQKLTKEIGEGTIKQLYDKGILKTYSDFFNITADDFLDDDGKNYIEGWQESSINIFLKGVKGITSSKDNEFLSSLFFENIGEDKFLKLFQKISFKELRSELDVIDVKIPEEFSEIKTKSKFLSELENLDYPFMETVKKIANVEGWGAIGIVRFINLWVEEKEALNKLLSVINITETDLVELLDEELKVVITGSVDNIPDYMQDAKGKSNRDKLKNYLKSLGHKSPGSVSGDTTCLVSDTVSTSGKFKDALDKGVPILTSEEFIEQYGAQLDVNNVDIKNTPAKVTGNNP